MGLYVLILLMAVIITGLGVWIFASKYYAKTVDVLKKENLELSAQVGLNKNLVNEISAEFAKIAQESLKNQQENLLSEHSNDLKTKIELFKAEEINPINRLLKEFKDSIDNYQQAHQAQSLDIKNSIATAEKYARALTSNQNLKGEFGENQLEQILKFVNLQENVHYTKQFVTSSAKPDFVINMPNSKHIIIDSKVILKNYIEYQQSEDDEFLKKSFIDDITNCITNLSKKNYEEIDVLNQPGFILLYIPIEGCINMIYTDSDCRKITELANSRNIIIIGTASLLVTLKLINRLWASQTQYDNVQNIITVGENLYNNIATHSQNLINIQQAIEKTASVIQTEINRFKNRTSGSIFKEAEKLHQFGILSKEVKSGKKISSNNIAQDFLNDIEELV